MTSATVDGDGVRLRKRPDGTIITKLNRGVVVDAFETVSGWTRVAVPGHGAGWVSAQFLESAAAAAGPGGAFNRERFFTRVDAMEGYLNAMQRQTCGQLLDACAGMPANWVAYVLATAAHETGKSFNPATRENLNYSVEGLKKTFSRARISAAECDALGRTPSRPANKDGIANAIYGGEWGRINLGNTSAGDGAKFVGRGLVQITGRANYTKISGKLNLGDALVGNPERVGEPAIALRIAVEGMSEGWFRGVKLGDRLRCGRPATAAEFVAARDIINGGRDKAPEIAEIAGPFQSMLVAEQWPA